MDSSQSPVSSAASVAEHTSRPQSRAVSSAPGQKPSRSPADAARLADSGLASAGIPADAAARAIAAGGNPARIAKAMRKAIRGEPVTVGVIGGSVTEGAAASDIAAASYGPLLAGWWRDTFPGSDITFVNAGKGATDSVIGVHRAEPDLLSKKPDFIVIEFSVNDSETELHKETYENLVRRCLKAEGNPGVLLLFMMMQGGANAQSIHFPVGRHYDLPMISYRDAVWPLVEAGKFKWSDLSPDTVHPSDKGHAIAALLIEKYLCGVYASLESAGETPKAVPAPLISDAYENARILTSADFQASKLGSFAVDGNAFFQFRNGWKATGGTQPAEFDLKKVKNIFVLYRRGPQSTFGKVKVQVNYGTSKTIDSYFPQLDYAYYERVAAAKNAGNQKVSVTPLPEDGRSEFRILGLMVS